MLNGRCGQWKGACESDVVEEGTSGAQEEISTRVGAVVSAGGRREGNGGEASSNCKLSLPQQ